MASVSLILLGVVIAGVCFCWWYLANSNPVPPIRGLRSREERVAPAEPDVGPCSDWTPPTTRETEGGRL